MINLLPPKRLLSMRTARANTILRRYINLILIGVIVIFAALAAAFYFLSSRQQNVKTVLEDHQKKVSALEPLQNEAQSLSVTVDTIASLLSRNIVFSEMLRSIGANMPPGAVLTGMQFSVETADAPLVISAEVEDEGKAAILRNNLVASGLFTSVEIKSITRNKEEETAVTQPGPSQTPPEGGEQTTATPPAPAQPAKKESPYKYTTVLNTTLKPVEAKR